MCTSLFVLILTSISWYSLLPRSCITSIFFVDHHWWVPLCVQHLATNYHTCIAMPTWRRCSPPILFWPWPLYNLLPRSCLTSIFFLDPHWWVPICLQCPVNAMPFQQISMHALQCQHDIDVQLLFCFDLDLLITCSRGRVRVIGVPSVYYTQILHGYPFTFGNDYILRNISHTCTCIKYICIPRTNVRTGDTMV